MTCIHEKECGAATICDLDNEQCIGMYPEHEQSDCQYYMTKELKEAEEYLESLTEEDLKKLAREA